MVVEYGVVPVVPSHGSTGGGVSKWCHAGATSMSATRLCFNQCRLKTLIHDTE